LDAASRIKVPLALGQTPARTVAADLSKHFLIYRKRRRMKEFLGLLFQTRQPAECFGCRTQECKVLLCEYGAEIGRLQAAANSRG
jgi:hypothetical protein